MRRDDDLGSEDGMREEIAAQVSPFLGSAVKACPRSGNTSYLPRAACNGRAQRCQASEAFAAL